MSSISAPSSAASYAAFFAKSRAAASDQPAPAGNGATAPDPKGDDNPLKPIDLKLEILNLGPLVRLDTSSLEFASIVTVKFFDDANTASPADPASARDALMTTALRKANTQDIDLDQPLRAILFDAADSNGNGTLTRAELVDQVVAGGGKADDAQNWFDRLDPQATGGVDRARFLAQPPADGQPEDRDQSFLAALRQSVRPGGTDTPDFNLCDRWLARVGGTAANRQALWDKLIA